MLKTNKFYFMYDTLKTIHISQNTCIFHIAMPMKRAFKYVFLAWSSLDLIFMLLPVGHYFCFWSLNKTKYYYDIYLLFVSLSPLVIAYNFNNQTRHLQSNLPMKSPLLISHLYLNVTLYCPVIENFICIKWLSAKYIFYHNICFIIYILL